MNKFGCGCNNNCTALAVIAGIILGVVAAFLKITGVITLTSAFLWVTFGIAVVYLAVLLLGAVIAGSNFAVNCACRIMPVLLTGILGTILASVILLGITFAATSITGAIISGALILFLTLIFSAVACFVKCLFGCDD